MILVKRKGKKWVRERVGRDRLRRRNKKGIGKFGNAREKENREWKGSEDEKV